MPKIKVSEATGATLDWMVAKCEGHAPELFDGRPVCGVQVHDEHICYTESYNYSTDWAQGGPIIERERISIRQWTNVPVVHACTPRPDLEWSSDGASPLIAAMRCYVASKLGDEVEVPEGLS